jgi:hypothetical protein
MIARSVIRLWERTGRRTQARRFSWRDWLLLPR